MSEYEIEPYIWIIYTSWGEGERGVGLVRCLRATRGHPIPRFWPFPLSKCGPLFSKSSGRQRGHKSPSASVADWVRNFTLPLHIQQPKAWGWRVQDSNLKGGNPSPLPPPPPPPPKHLIKRNLICLRVHVSETQRGKCQQTQPPSTCIIASIYQPTKRYNSTSRRYSSTLIYIYIK